MLPQGYDPRDIKDAEHKAYLKGYRLAVVDAVSLCFNLDTYKEESLLAHEICENEGKQTELQGIVQDWLSRTMDETIIRLLDEESVDEG